MWRLGGSMLVWNYQFCLIGIQCFILHNSFQEMTSAILGKKDVAIKNGLKWLLSDIEQHYQTLNQRVERDVKERDIQIEKEMAEKRERIRLRKE